MGPHSPVTCKPQPPTATTTTTFKIVLMLDAIGIKRLISHKATPTMMRAMTRFIKGIILLLEDYMGTSRSTPSRASPVGFESSEFLIALQVFPRSQRQILLGGFERALHGLLIHTGVFPPGIVHIDHTPLSPARPLHSQLPH